ncbi:MULTISPECIES: hypothetical protein [Clostridium]|nr:MULTISPECIES: hypothetical protein [Clostridium]MDU7251292.1 hypothetical protein [Clostridium sp.]
MNDIHSLSHVKWCCKYNVVFYQNIEKNHFMIKIRECEIKV